MIPLRAGTAFTGVMAALAGSAVGTALLFAQLNDRRSFEVVSIKPSQIVPLRSGTLSRIRIDRDQVNISSISALDLLAMALRTPAAQLDGPSWLASKAYEIRGKLPANTSADVLPDMLQTLCIDRLGLAFHRESKVRPVYSLLVVKGGPNLTAASATQESVPSGTAGSMWTPLGQVQMVGDGQGPPRMVGRGFQMTFSDRQLEFQFSTVHDLIAFLSLESDLPIVDNTALAGAYRIKVTVPMGGPVPVRADGTIDDSTQGPLDIYTDSLAKMGLRLSPGKAAVETIVVDRMNESPTEN